MDQRIADSEQEAALAEAEIGEARKPYLRPQLVRLGTWADMTRAVGGRGAHDGGRFRGRDRTAR
jgi:hypothetical protein